MRISSEGKIILNEKTLKEIEKLEKYISVLSVIGPYRSGKSFLLNRFHGRQKGFQIGNTTNPCTQGVWYWGDTDFGSDSDYTILLDTEGMFAYNRDEKTDMVLFLFTSFISSLMIYNTFGIIDESSIERFFFLINLGSFFNFNEYVKNNLRSQISDYFPHLVWLLRDFSLDLKSITSNKEMTPKEYLEMALMIKNKKSENKILKNINESALHRKDSLLRQSTIKDQIDAKKVQNMKNKIRKKIKQIFTKRDCFTLVRPINDEELLRNVEKIPYEDLRDKFKT